MARLLYILEEIAAEENMERQAQRRATRERYLHQGPTDREFLNTFRLTPEVFETLCGLVVPLLPPQRNIRGIDPTIKVL